MSSCWGRTPTTRKILNRSSRPYSDHLAISPEAEALRLLKAHQVGQCVQRSHSKSRFTSLAQQSTCRGCDVRIRVAVCSNHLPGHDGVAGPREFPVGSMKV